MKDIKTNIPGNLKCNTSDIEKQYDEILGLLPVPAIEIDTKAQILQANSLAEQLLQQASVTVENLSLFDITSSEYKQQINEILGKLEEGAAEKVINIEVKWRSLDNDFITLLLNFSKVVYKGKDQILVVFEDISKYEQNNDAYKRQFEEMQIARDDLEERTSELAVAYEKLGKSELELETLNKNKDRFFSIISHDLRSPFSSLMGLTSLILEDFDSFTKDEIKDSMYNLHQVSESLYHMIEDLLDWSRIQFNKIDFQPKVLNLYEVAQKVCGILKAVAKDKNISIVNIVPKNCTTKADEHMITTVIRNLIGNAIKFTPKYGMVKISAGFHIDDLIVSVEDTGVGMSQEIVSNLFNMGKKVSKNGTEGESGTGLGLIICKEFVETHGGKIWAESEIEKGSKFIFRIPVEPEEVTTE